MRNRDFEFGVSFDILGCKTDRSTLCSSSRTSSSQSEAELAALIRVVPTYPAGKRLDCFDQGPEATTLDPPVWWIGLDLLLDREGSEHKATALFSLTSVMGQQAARCQLRRRALASTNCYQEQLSLGNTAVSSPRAGA